MAATDVARKLHAAGLVENLQLQGATEVAERNSAALSNELGWYASDPKSAVVNFAVSRRLNLSFDFEASKSNDAVSLLSLYRCVDRLSYVFLTSAVHVAAAARPAGSDGDSHTR
eukprot:COSAG02_NODE_31_length_50774_cov_1928.118204_19_plen_114_part_00